MGFLVSFTGHRHEISYLFSHFEVLSFCAREAVVERTEMSALPVGKVLTPKMKKKGGSTTLFRRKCQWKNALTSINRT